MLGRTLKFWERLSCLQQKKNGINLLQRCNSLGTNELLLYYNTSNTKMVFPFVRAILRFSTSTVRNNLRYELKNKPISTETVNKCMLCSPFFHILWNFEALEAVEWSRRYGAILETRRGRTCVLSKRQMEICVHSFLTWPDKPCCSCWLMSQWKTTC